MLRGAFLLTLLPVAALAQSGQSRGMGEEWVGADGNQRHAQMGIQFDRPLGADPALVRKLTLNWRDFPYQKGGFPVPVGEDDVSVTVGVSITVDANGVPTGCTVTQRGERAAFDAHACPHIQRYIRFHPALTQDGERVGGTLKLRVIYTAGRIRSYSSGTVPTLWRPRARPVKPLDASAVGFSRADKLAAHVHGVTGWLRIEADGRASACSLDTPTMDDAFDMGVCARMRAWPFEPALDRAGKPVASDYGFGVSRPR